MRTVWPFRHLGLKLLSVGFALVLWLVVSGEETVERTLRVPLELQQFPAGLELVGDALSNVEVRLRGASGTLARLGASDVIAEVDLRAARPGRRLFRLTPEDVRVPFGVDVVQVNPPTVAMSFERSTSRQIPIVPAIDGKPAPGFVINGIDVVPDRIEVVGPESSVARAADAFTEPVSVAGAREAVKENVTVGVLDSTLRLKGPAAASVTVRVLPAPMEHTFRDMPVHLRHLPTNLVAMSLPASVAVTLRGSREAFARAETEGVDVYVDVSGLGPGTYTLPIHVDAGEAGVTRLQPGNVQVRIANGKE